MKFAFQTFGCRLNRAEALDREASLAADGNEIVPVGNEADVIIVRGCSVTAKAQRDCEKTIAHLRAKFPAAEIRVEGCLEQTFAKRSPPPCPPVEKAAATVPMRTSRAYLKVQDGCSGRCAFCIVPHFRGPPVSVPFSDVLARARAFLDAGYQEIIVTGCNLALYRDNGRGLPALLDALAVLNADTSHRIRLGSWEPGLCDEALLNVFETRPNICRFLHLSLQSGSESVLRRMNRPYTAAAVEHFCTTARTRLGPHLALGADVITGFPGETEAEFAETQALFTRIPFVNPHVFPYSERPGTPAATMPGALPPAVRTARARELEASARKDRAAFARGFVGKTVEVCIESENTGWTAEYLSCHIIGAPLPRRALVSARVVSVLGDTLTAEPLS